MATRQESNDRRMKLTDHVRSLCEKQRITGGALPPMRQLSKEFGLSLSVTQSVIKQLQSEGSVSSTRGAGTSIAQLRFIQDEVFLYLDHASASGKDESHETMIIGFTTRLAELGAFTVSVPDYECLSVITGQSSLQIMGLYGNSYDTSRKVRSAPDVPYPQVGFAEHVDLEKDDCVVWDDVNGGRAVTQHLLSLGHQSIVFVGDITAPFRWASDRANGYRDAMVTSGNGRNIRSLAWEMAKFEPDLAQVGKDAARTLASEILPDAVIACNDHVAISFLQELHYLGVPLPRWPAIVGFDGIGRFSGQLITSMRLDGREVGRAAANLLWDRAHGKLKGPPTTHFLEMSLVPTLTSQQGWAYRLHRLINRFPIDELAATFQKGNQI